MSCLKFHATYGFVSDAPHCLMHTRGHFQYIYVYIAVLSSRRDRPLCFTDKLFLSYIRAHYLYDQAYSHILHIKINSSKYIIWLTYISIN